MIFRSHISQNLFYFYFVSLKCNVTLRILTFRGTSQFSSNLYFGSGNVQLVFWILEVCEDEHDSVVLSQCLFRSQDGSSKKVW